MNKKGLSSLINFPLGLIGFFILILVLVSLLPMQFNPEMNNEANRTQILEILNTAQHDALQTLMINESDNPIIKVTYSFCSFIIYSALEVTKTAFNWGSANVDIVNPHMLLKLIILCLLIPIILPLFKISIIIFILTKEYFQSKKEKKELKQCQKKKKS